MNFEDGKLAALEALCKEPQAVIFEHSDAFAVGSGYAVAKGWAVYCGDGDFKNTIAGKSALQQMDSAQ